MGAFSPQAPPEMAVFQWTLRALLSHWRRHPVQFFSVLTGLWLATALLIGVQALNSQARDSYARASQLIGGEPQASLGAPDGASFPRRSLLNCAAPGGRCRRWCRGGYSSRGGRMYACS